MIAAVIAGVDVVAVVAEYGAAGDDDEARNRDGEEDEHGETA